jgi:hypothetical protein
MRIILCIFIVIFFSNYSFTQSEIDSIEVFYYPGILRTKSRIPTGEALTSLSDIRSFTKKDNFVLIEKRIKKRCKIKRILFKNIDIRYYCKVYYSNGTVDRLEFDYFKSLNYNERKLRKNRKLFNAIKNECDKNEVSRLSSE